MELCTVEDLIDRISERSLIQLTDDSTPPLAVNTARCEQAIAMASEVVQSRLAGRYTDVSSIQKTPLLTMIAVDIAVYMLYSRRNQGVIENVRRRYDDALSYLDKIQLNEATPPSLNARSQEYLCNKRRSDRTFSARTWERY